MFEERIFWGGPSDLRTIKKWGEGVLRVDAINGTCQRNHRRVRSLWIAGELQGWLAKELEKQDDPPDDVQAILDVVFSNASTIPGAMDLVFDITATVTTGGLSFVDRFEVSLGEAFIPP
jgi:hypothetical protein